MVYGADEKKNRKLESLNEMSKIKKDWLSFENSVHYFVCVK